VKLLLDTHALLWWMDDSPALGAPGRALIEDPGNDVWVSVASLWEIVIKVQVGKLESDVGEIVAAMDAQGIGVLHIRQAHFNVLAHLPRHHKDPFDHLLIAQAMAEGATLMSEDRQMALYPAACIRCSSVSPGEASSRSGRRTEPSP
jgi:PIN domain nuclease of toxin-antitoxin system